MRIFEALGTGSLLMTNRLAPESGLEELFVDGEHLVIYDDWKHLLHLINYYLEHEDERERIALNGYHEALNKHTYEHRIAQIISTVQDDIFRMSPV